MRRLEQPEGIWETPVHRQYASSEILAIPRATATISIAGASILSGGGRSGRRTCSTLRAGRRAAFAPGHMHAIARAATLNDVVWVRGLTSAGRARHGRFARGRRATRVCLSSHSRPGAGRSRTGSARGMLARQKDFYQRDKKAATALCSTDRARKMRSSTGGARITTAVCRPCSISTRPFPTNETRNEALNMDNEFLTNSTALRGGASSAPRPRHWRRLR